MICSKCQLPTGEWRTVWLADTGGTMQEWIPHICRPADSEVAVATPEEK